MMISSSEDGSLGRDQELKAMAEMTRESYQTVERKTQVFIRSAILRGLYRPGERLHQDRIAELLGVSRMPVRASLNQLVAEGLVTVRPHQGATVSALRPGEIAEYYELRILLESYLLEHAIPRLSPQRLQELSSLERRADDDREDALADRLERRRDFYRRLYELAGRPRALEMVEQLRTAVGRYLLLVRVDERPTAHLGLLEHLEQRDISGAQRWIAHHLNNVSTQLQHLVEEESGHLE